MAENMLIAHGGGPTPVINRSLLGAVKEAQKSSKINKIYAARFGANGILSGDVIDLTDICDKRLENLANTPASAIGSCRRKLSTSDMPAIMASFDNLNIGYFFYNGGNDSMDTCNKIYEHAKTTGRQLGVIGIPKTIDNDLAVTDHSPGFGSAAKFAAVSALELSCDAASLPIHVVVMEVMGRNAGWLTAASALYRDRMACELLTYLPEMNFDENSFLNAVKERSAKGRGLLVTVSEGIHFADGRPVADSGVTDGFGHKIPGGAAQTLSELIIKKTDLKSRSEKPGLLGRVSMANVSKIDADEAEEAGRFAVIRALAGDSGFMVCINAERNNGDYVSHMSLTPLANVANTEKKFPLEWITPDGVGVSNDFRSYCEPLVGLPPKDYLMLVNKG